MERDVQYLLALVMIPSWSGPLGSNPPLGAEVHRGQAARTLIIGSHDVVRNTPCRLVKTGAEYIVTVKRQN